MKTDAVIEDILKDALQNGLLKKDCVDVIHLKKAEYKLDNVPFNQRKFVLVTCLIIVVFVMKSPTLLRKPQEFFQDIKADYFLKTSDNCALEHTSYTLELTRPVSTCSICKGISEIPIVTNISREYFLKKHAYTGSPVLIKGGASNWTALNIFSYQYFKLLYDKMDYDENDDLGCQFFPYKTNFKTLKQVFRMSNKRAALKKDQWYVGWSNCVPRIAKALRRHYNRPEFLPSDSESSHLDWMFMGGSGTGAQMHIDAVNRPSWQAMIKGKKTWLFEPPPECENVCVKRMNVTMESGDILIVDTNKWYHSTYIHPGNLSVTIGSEYD